MKKIIVICLLSLTIGGAKALSEVQLEASIQWMDFNEGYAKANAEGKIAIIDCYTDWCGWCKVMDKKTFTDSTVISRMGEDFVAIKFNPELKGKSYVIGGDTLSGPELLYALSNNKPSGYPTLFYYVPQNRRMFQQPGYQKVDDLLTQMDHLLTYQNKLKSN